MALASCHDDRDNDDGGDDGDGDDEWDNDLVISKYGVLILRERMLVITIEREQ